MKLTKVQRYIVDNMPVIIRNGGGIADKFSPQIVPMNGATMCVTTRIDASQSVWFIELKEDEEQDKSAVQYLQER